jgi:hypothetical protein
MGSKQKQTQVRQKEHFERKLKDRLSFLSEKGTESSEINKDAFTKKLKAHIRAMDERLKAIAKLEKRTEDLAKKKAKKAAAPQKAPEGSKDKESKKAPEEGKEKKKKKETKETKEAKETKATKAKE